MTLTWVYSPLPSLHVALCLLPQGIGLFPLVKSIILTPSYLHAGPVSDHWHVRKMSALCLAEITHRCGTPLNEYIPAIYTSFRHVLAQSDVSLNVLYGVVLSLCQLGGKVMKWQSSAFEYLNTISQLYWLCGIFCFRVWRRCCSHNWTQFVTMWRASLTLETWSLERQPSRSTRLYW